MRPLSRKPTDPQTLGSTFRTETGGWRGAQQAAGGIPVKTWLKMSSADDVLTVRRDLVPTVPHQTKAGAERDGLGDNELAVHMWGT